VSSRVASRVELRNKLLTLVFAAVLVVSPLQMLLSQDLAPRAYIITPVHWNAVTLTYSLSDGGVSTDNAVPITDATAVLHVSIFNYFHSLNFFGRSANILASLPYGVAHYQGTFMDDEKRVYRSGLLDSVFRFSVNLKGGPAMSVKKYDSWRQKTILGVSIRMGLPQVNTTAQRWSTMARTAGPSNPNLAIRNGGAIWCWMHTRGYRSSPRTLSSFRTMPSSLALRLDRKTPSAPSKVI
jgi:hypothetical protein